MTSKKWMKGLLNKIFLILVSLWICISWAPLNQPDPPYFIPKGILTKKKKSEMLNQMDMRFSKLSEEQKIDYKFNFILLIVKDQNTCDSLWKSRIDNISYCLSYYYKINQKKEIEIKFLNNYDGDTSQGVYVGQVLVHRN